jgi:hypothetical protein
MSLVVERVAWFGVHKDWRIDVQHVKWKACGVYRGVLTMGCPAYKAPTVYTDSTVYADSTCRNTQGAVPPLEPRHVTLV